MSARNKRNLFARHKSNLSASHKPNLGLSLKYISFTSIRIQANLCAYTHYIRAVRRSAQQNTAVGRGGRGWRDLPGKPGAGTLAKQTWSRDDHSIQITTGGWDHQPSTLERATGWVGGWVLVRTGDVTNENDIGAPTNLDRQFLRMWNIHWVSLESDQTCAQRNKIHLNKYP